MDPIFPYPMHYLGSKGRIAEWILDCTFSQFGEPELFVDIMAGSGAVAHLAHLQGIKIGVNDIQPYSSVLLEAAFSTSRADLADILQRISQGEVQERLLQNGRKRFQKSLDAETQYLSISFEDSQDLSEVNDLLVQDLGNPLDCLGKFDLFASYYRNTYLGVKQCLEVDTLSEIAAESCNSSAKHIKAALVSAVSRLSSSTTHVAQYLKPGSLTQTKLLARKRSESISEAVLECLKNVQDYPVAEESKVFNRSFEEVIPLFAQQSDALVIYADPPYFKEHYSRYYHLLDTLVLYDYPELTWNPRLGDITVGRYRKERLVSNFGLKSKVRMAFEQLMKESQKAGARLALSYADTSLLSLEEVLKIANDLRLQVTVEEMQLKHSGQGNKNHLVTEYLFLIGE